MCELHALYQFSVRWFLHVFEGVLQATNPEGVEGSSESGRGRVTGLMCKVFSEAYRQASISLLEQHRVCLALRLSQLRAPGAIDKQELDVLLGCHALAHQHDGDENQQLPRGVPELSRKQWKRVDRLCRLPNFINMRSHMEQHHPDWAAMLKAPLAERHVPTWDDDAKTDTPASALWRTLLVLHALRPDRLIPAMRTLIHTVLLGDVQQEDAAQHTFTDIVNAVPSWMHAIVLCSAAGFDVGARVVSLAAERGVACTVLAMGSAEGIDAADKAVTHAAQHVRPNSTTVPAAASYASESYMPLSCLASAVTGIIVISLVAFSPCPSCVVSQAEQGNHLACGDMHYLSLVTCHLSLVTCHVFARAPA
jgi:dynein heavy chain 1